MSEPSPWGQPPPPGYEPSPGAAGAGGTPPPPPKRNGAMIVATVLAVLVVITALVVSLVVRAGEDGIDQAGGAGQGPRVASSGPTMATATAPTSEGANEKAVPDEAITGNGYYFKLPGIGWQNALDEAQSSGLEDTLDSIIILGPSLDLAQSNILVEALTAGGAPDLEALEEQWKRNLSGVDGAVADDLPDIMIDGERAIGVRFTDRENVNGLLIDQIAYLTLHEGNQFSVALSLPSEDDAVSEADFEKLLSSWTWTD